MVSGAGGYVAEGVRVVEALEGSQEITFMTAVEYDGKRNGRV